MKNSKQNKFVVRGVLLGLVFPVVAFILCSFVLTPPNESITLAGLHKEYPLLFIIDSAPLVLGAVSFAVGRQVCRTDNRYLSTIEMINGDLTKKNKELEHMIDEKEVLLKEIHHRVKNNLQIITSLLSLQSNFIEDEKTKGLFRYCQYRVNSMAMVHKMLYQSNDLSQINYREYVKNLLDNLVTSMRGSSGDLKLEIDIPDIHLNIDTAIPLGLLINEIATNALKYGLRDHGGTFHLIIRKTDHNRYKMLIGDNGVGFPEDINFRNTNSLGLILIHRLTIQLKGTIEMDRTLPGTNYIVIFEEVNQLN